MIHVDVGSFDTLPFRLDSNYHGGSKQIRRISIFNERSRLDTTLQVWDFDPGASEGVHAHGAPDGAGEAAKHLALLDRSKKGMVPETVPLEEMYIVLSGTMIVRMPNDEAKRINGNVREMRVGIGSEVLVLHPHIFMQGDCIRFPPGVPHGVENASSTERLRILVVWGRPMPDTHGFLRGLKMSVFPSKPPRLPRSRY